jgi:hypothetical protein
LYEVALTVPKRGRRERGEPCQDAALVLRRANCVVLTVADGVGTAPRSEIGAHFATQVIGSHLVQEASTRPNKLIDAVRSGRREWQNAVEAAPESARKVTFGFAVIRPPTIAIGTIGDCFIFSSNNMRTESADLLLDCGRPPGAYANELPVSLGHPDWETGLRYCEMFDPTMTAVAVSSDGLQAVAIREGVIPGQGVRQVDVVPHFTEWLLEKARRRMSGTAIANELESWDELMTMTGDDLGVAMAVW